MRERRPMIVDSASSTGTNEEDEWTGQVIVITKEKKSIDGGALEEWETITILICVFALGIDKMIEGKKKNFEILYVVKWSSQLPYIIRRSGQCHRPGLDKGLREGPTRAPRQFLSIHGYGDENTDDVRRKSRRRDQSRLTNWQSRRNMLHWLWSMLFLCIFSSIRFFFPFPLQQMECGEQRHEDDWGHTHDVSKLLVTLCTYMYQFPIEREKKRYSIIDLKCFSLAHQNWTLLPTSSSKVLSGKWRMVYYMKRHVSLVLPKLGYNPGSTSRSEGCVSSPAIILVPHSQWRHSMTLCSFDAL